MTRHAPGQSVTKKIMSVFNDGGKVILVLCDEQMRELLDLRCKNGRQPGGCKLIIEASGNPYSDLLSPPP